MIYLDRVAREIKRVGFYDSLLQDVKAKLGREDVSESEIKELLQKDGELLQEYKDLNLEYNLSNIHIKTIDTSRIEGRCQEAAKLFNENLQKLKELEKYTLDFSRSSFLVILFSVEFFVLFSVQYFIVLLSLKEYQWLIYSLFLSSIAIAWWYAKKERQKYEKNAKYFHEMYEETIQILNELEKSGCINKKSLYIEESEEHV